jgi:hypothetical protein
VDAAGLPITTAVTLGDVDDRYAEVTAGLNASDWVLTDNHRFLRDGDKINITRVVASKD